MKTSDGLSNPFPGLRPFEFNENHLFFGRERQSERLLKKLRRKRFLAVVGTSGSGKSSLVRAGLLPLLYGGFMTKAGPHWRLAIFRPGVDPIHNMAEALNSPTVFEPSQEETREAAVEQEERARASAFDIGAVKVAATETILRRSALGLVDWATRAKMRGNENLLVVVDQFEELFRFKERADSLHSEDEAAAFVKLLLEAVRDKSVPLYVALTMRSDFLGDCAQFRDLPETINESQYLIPRLTREQQRNAITRPAAVRGAEMTPRLVQKLLNDVGDNPDHLPILQHALMRTWDFWAGEQNKSQPIDLEHYEAIGEMAAALSKHADEAYAELHDKRSKKIAENLFKALTETVQDNREVRRPVELREICAISRASSQEVARVIETFRRPGRSFLMPPDGVPLGDDSLIDVSHESLIRGWALLKSWVEEEAQSAQMYKRVAEEALLYKEGKTGLLRDPGLTLALEWRETQQPNKEWARRYNPALEEALSFLQASEEQRAAEALEEKRRQEEQLEREKRELEDKQALAEARRDRAEAEQKKAEAEQRRAEEAQRAAQRESEFNLALATEQQQLAETEHKRAEEQAKSARRLRYLVAALLLMFLLASVTAAYALKQRSDALKAKQVAEAATMEAENQRHEALKQKQEALNQKQEAEAQRSIALDQRNTAETERKRADEQALLARETSDKLKISLAREEKISREREVARQQALEQTRLARASETAAIQARELAEVKEREAAAAALSERTAKENAERLSERDKKIRGAILDIQIRKFEEAIAALNDARKAYEKDKEGEGWVDFFLGDAYRAQYKYEQAKEKYRSAITNVEAALGKNAAKTVPARDRMAHLYREQGQFGSAADTYKELLTILEINGDNDSLVNTKIDLADLLSAQGKDLVASFKRKGEEIRNLNKEINERLLENVRASIPGGVRPPDSATLLGVHEAMRDSQLSADEICRKLKTSFVEACKEYNRFREQRDDSFRRAQALFNEVLESRETQLPVTHPTLANLYTSLAEVYQEQSGKTALVEALTKLASQIRSLNDAEKSKEMSIGQTYSLAAAYERAERIKQAAKMYTSILETRKALLKEKQNAPNRTPEAVEEARDDLVQAILSLAHLYEGRRNYEAAEPYYQSVLAIEKESGAPIWTDKIFHTTLAEDVGKFYFNWKKYPEAEQALKRNRDLQAEAARKEPGAENARNLAESINSLSYLFQSQNKLEEAISYKQEALRVLEGGLEKDNAVISNYLFELAELYYQQGKVAAAEPLYERARLLSMKVVFDKSSDSSSRGGWFMVSITSGYWVGVDPLTYPQSLNRLASIYIGRNKLEEAEKFYDEALAGLEIIKEKVVPSPAPGRDEDRYWKQPLFRTYANILRSYAELLQKTNRQQKATELLKQAEEMERKSREAASDRTSLDCVDC